MQPGRFCRGTKRSGHRRAYLGSPQRTAPKSKAQVIGELASKLQKPGMTSGRATIAAEQTYAEAEKRFGSNAPQILEMIQPGQDPRRFLDGFQNAYLAGKMGSSATLKSSGAAAYLTQAQRQEAYDMGVGSLQRNSVEIGSRSGSTTSQEKKTDLLSVLKDGTIEERKAAFKKAFQEGLISKRISPQKQARHIRGTKAFLNYESAMAQNGDHPSYIGENLSEKDLNRLVVNRLQGEVRIVGNHYYEYVDCDEVIGYYYSKHDGRYIPTKCAQIAYAIGNKNIHIIPVKEK